MIAKHFLQTYSWVNRAEVKVEALNWQRVRGDHVHAFVSTPTYTRWAKAIVEGKYSAPKVTAGLKGLRLLKTTKSGFVNFVDDAYRVLPDSKDRIMSTVVEAEWTYRHLNNLNFCKAFEEVEKSLIDNFAGPSSTGSYSSSVQQTLYEAQVSFVMILPMQPKYKILTLQVQALRRVPQMDQIFVAMPNKHYFNVDLSKFPRSVGGCPDNNEVFMPVDKPSGYIQAVLGQKDLKSKL